MPQTECPAQEEAWRSTTERTPGAFRRLMSQCGSGVENCLLPDSVAGFVEGEHCSVLLKALGDGHLRPIGSMVDASVRDRNKPGACYVYFRVMKRGETPIRMAFGSVGSSRMEYKARMLFRPRIWTASRGGYVSDRDGGAGYTPNTTSILFPPSTGGEEGARVAVPLVTLAHHNAVGLDSVRIKLCAAAAVDEEEKLLLDFSPPGRASGEPPLLTEMELCFRCDDPPEGTARVTTEMNKSL